MDKGVRRPGSSRGKGWAGWMEEGGPGRTVAASGGLGLAQAVGHGGCVEVGVVLRGSLSMSLRPDHRHMLSTMWGCICHRPLEHKPQGGPLSSWGPWGAQVGPSHSHSGVGEFLWS